MKLYEILILDIGGAANAILDGLLASYCNIPNSIAWLFWLPGWAMIILAFLGSISVIGEPLRQ